MHIADENCAFNRIYKLNNSISTGEQTIEQIRFDLSSAFGNCLKQLDLDIDVISPIPNTGRLYSDNLASILGKKSTEIFEKARRVRTLPLDTAKRQEYYDNNLDIIQENLNQYKHSHVLFVDEALLSGLTLTAVANLCKKNGLKNYSFALMSPPNFLACPFSHINPKARALPFQQIQLLGAKKSVLELRELLGAKHLIFTPFDVFKTAVGGKNVCTLCFLNHPDLDTLDGVSK